jgi:hypothetical protein
MSAIASQQCASAWRIGGGPCRVEMCAVETALLPAADRACGQSALAMERTAAFLLL